MTSPLGLSKLSFLLPALFRLWKLIVRITTDWPCWFRRRPCSRFSRRPHRPQSPRRLCRRRGGDLSLLGLVDPVVLLVVLIVDSILTMQGNPRKVGGKSEPIIWRQSTERVSSPPSHNTIIVIVLAADSQHPLDTRLTYDLQAVAMSPGTWAGADWNAICVETLFAWKKVVLGIPGREDRPRSLRDHCDSCSRRRSMNVDVDWVKWDPIKY